MAFVLADWVWETTTTTGTGAVTLLGNATNARTFSTQLANGDTTYYSIWDGTDFEEGLATYTSAGNTLTRTTVYRSSNAGAAVNWGVGTRQVMCAVLGVTLQSLLTPGSTGFPRRTADNTWAYYSTVGSGTVIPLATAPVFTTSWGLGSDPYWAYETTNTIGIHTTASDAHTAGQGLIENCYTYYTDAANYERWQFDFGVGSGALQIKHQTAGTYVGNTRSITLFPSDKVIAQGTNAALLSVGQNGGTNPAFIVDTSTASSATGISVKSAAAAGGAALAVISSGLNENLTINAKGSGTITIGSVSTGGITATRAVTLSAGATASAGTASVAPFKMTSGTNLTTAAAGAWEYDGSVAYFTNNASNRGLMPSEQWAILQSATYTLTSQTAAQKLFNASTNGTITLPVGTFDFDCFYSLTSMSVSSGTFGFALGGTATFTQQWMSWANMATAATAANWQSTWNTAANTALTTANTTGTGQARVKGMIRVTVAGTIIPQVSLGVAAAAVVGVLSSFKIKQVSANSTATIGNWS